eukprot:XP_011661732.1 PREDICTED: CMP-N-acetylneuraminate-poly-alpha-2,8-sialyltransferase-like [Strongylocentrotus purpuratus]
MVAIGFMFYQYTHFGQFHDCTDAIHAIEEAIDESSNRQVRLGLEGQFLGRPSNSLNCTNNTSCSNKTFVEESISPLHRLVSKDEIFRKVSEHWQNVTELNEARVREVRKEIEKNSEKFSAVDLRFFLRTVVNETAAAEIRRKVSKTVSRCQAMQIVRSNVPDNGIVFESTLQNVRERNQSDCVPLYDSCAIVGNSGILLDSECGDVIDSADYVIRNNMAITDERFVKDVGMRIDAMTINLQLIYSLTICTNVHKGGKLPPRTTCESLMERMKIFQEGRLFWFFKRYTKLFHEMKAMLTALRKKYKLNFRVGYSPIIPMDTAKSLAKVPVPSSGLAVYIAATQFCKSVNLFGFYPFNDRGKENNTVMAHYYDDEVFPFSKNHKMPKEYAWLEDLDRRGALRMINDCTSLRK